MKKKIIQLLVYLIIAYISGNVNEVRSQTHPDLVLCHQYNNTFTDFSGHGNNGTQPKLSVSFTTDRNGTSSEAITTDTNRYISVPHNSSLDLRHCFTIMAWVKPSTNFGSLSFNNHIDIVSTWGDIAAASQAAGNLHGYGGYLMGLDPYGHVSGWTYDGYNYKECLSNSTIQANVWTHIAISYDGANMRIFINGVLDATVSDPYVPQNSIFPLRIGHEGDNDPNRFPSNAQKGFKGSIDEVRIFKKVLSNENIQYCMNSGTCPSLNDLRSTSLYLNVPDPVCVGLPVTVTPSEDYYIQKGGTYYWGDGTTSTTNTHTYNTVGRYGIKYITNGFCKDTTSDSIDVVNCATCDVTPYYQRIGCYGFRLKYKSKFVNVECYKWVIDGVIVSTFDPYLGYVATPGPHHICLHYFGVNKHYPNMVCCGEACMDIDVPVPILQNDTIERCDLQLDSNCIEVDLNTYAPAGTTSYIDPLAHTITSGSHSICLPEGDYYIEFYDSKGCILKKLNLKIIIRHAPTYICSRHLIDSCQFTTDPQTVFPDPNDCPECMMTSTSIVTPAVMIFSDATHREYARDITDPVNCKICHFQFDITIWNECLVHADFIVSQTNTSGGLRFDNTSTGTGSLCPGVNNPVWQIFQAPSPSAGFVQVGPNEFGQTLNHNFSTPGYYKVCLQVQYCNKCGKECQDQKCMIFLVNPDGSIQIISEDPVPPPANENSINGNSGDIKIQGINKDVEISDPNIQVHPNPSEGVYNIIYHSNLTELHYDIEIIDVNGNSIYVKKGLTINKEETFDISSHSNGIYFAKITYGNKTEFVKVLKN